MSESSLAKACGHGSPPSPDLHAAWLSKNGYFFSVLALTIVSSLFYLLASLLDPGFLPKSELTRKEVLASFKAKSLKVRWSLMVGGKDWCMLAKSSTLNLRECVDGVSIKLVGESFKPP